MVYWPYTTPPQALLLHYRSATTLLHCPGLIEPDCSLCSSRLKSLFLAGERCDVETLNWAKRSFGVPVLDHWWQTGKTFICYWNIIMDTTCYTRTMVPFLDTGCGITSDPTSPLYLFKGSEFKNSFNKL